MSRPPLPSPVNAWPCEAPQLLNQPNEILMKLYQKKATLMETLSLDPSLSRGLRRNLNVHCQPWEMYGTIPPNQTQNPKPEAETALVPPSTHPPAGAWSFGTRVHQGFLVKAPACLCLGERAPFPWSPHAFLSRPCIVARWHCSRSICHPRWYCCTATPRLHAPATLANPIWGSARPYFLRPSLWKVTSC